MIDFGLKDPAGIRKVGEYEVPLDEQLRIQAAEQIICMDLCMFRDHCDGFCIANQEWKESMLNLLLGKVQNLAVFTSATLTNNGFRMPPTAAVVSNFKKVSKDMKRHTLSVFVDDPLDPRADEDGYFTMPLF